MDTRTTLAILPPAAYLRYHPHNSHAVERHHQALRCFAARLGLPAPTLYLDNDYPSSGTPPHLGQLVRAVMNGSHRVLLVPGPWVFSSDDARARLVIRVLTQAGCRRVLTLPAPHRRRPAFILVTDPPSSPDHKRAGP
ncbi:hypothetical protein [Streptomyces sp. NBC_00829]|uniref:hypothetical protein n=1 Tax=Streptomyces sp. NBC_00829 TaxID=2903679 RepID=UPI00386AE723|nr:hypothetical protein OG293_33355 [Streptomyces sp. NBC_00829]